MVGNGEQILYSGSFLINYAGNDSSGDYSGDVEFTNQDSTNNIINNQNENTNSIIESITTPADVSGELSEFLSGEVLADKLGFNSIAINDRIQNVDDFYLTIAQEVRDIILESRDYTITFPWASANITLRSQDFITNDNAIKVFARDFLVFVVVFLYIKYIVSFIHRVQEGNFVASVNHVEVNDDSILL